MDQKRTIYRDQIRPGYWIKKERYVEVRSGPDIGSNKDDLSRFDPIRILDPGSKKNHLEIIGKSHKNRQKITIITFMRIYTLLLTHIIDNLIKSNGSINIFMRNSTKFFFCIFLEAEKWSGSGIASNWYGSTSLVKRKEWQTYGQNDEQIEERYYIIMNIWWMYFWMKLDTFLLNEM